MPIKQYYRSEKQRYLDSCTLCGLCADQCPVLPFTNARDASSQDIQEAVHQFMADGQPSDWTYTKAFACMECFKCTADMCPEDLNPMLVNELIKGIYIENGWAKKVYEDAAAPDSTHRVLASVQVSAADYRRITTISEKKTARYVFFPGCNVYFQPEKLLCALDIMDAITDDYAFLPGLDFCCGDSLYFMGDTDTGGERSAALVDKIASFQPEAVVLWCPTCQCRFDKTIAHAMDLPFKVLSFPQFLAANMDRLPLTDAAAGTVTLHDPCKSAYTGVDLNGTRDVLRQLPGVVLKEMERHGPEAACCGSGAICYFPQSDSAIREERLEEAARTGAERLVAVCHYCNQTFAAEETRFNFTVTNYVNLVAEAMGIGREDRFKKYTHWGDLERILADVEPFIAESPFARERICEVLQATFVR